MAERGSSAWGRWLLHALLVGVVVLGSACTSARFDIRTVKHPVVMNGNPVLCAPGRGPVLHEVSEVAACSDDFVPSRLGDLGSDPRRGVTDLSLECSGSSMIIWLDLLAGFSGANNDPVAWSTITAEGKVKEIEPASGGGRR